MEIKHIIENGGDFIQNVICRKTYLADRKKYRLYSVVNSLFKFGSIFTVLQRREIGTGQVEMQRCDFNTSVQRGREAR